MKGTDNINTNTMKERWRGSHTLTKSAETWIQAGFEQNYRNVFQHSF